MASLSRSPKEQPATRFQYTQGRRIGEIKSAENLIFIICKSISASTLGEFGWQLLLSRLVDRLPDIIQFMLYIGVKFRRRREMRLGGLEFDHRLIHLFGPR
jgi:hypothetical protein